MNIMKRAAAAGLGVFLMASLGAADLRPLCATTAYGNIMLESKNPKEVYAQALKICGEMNASIMSYNSYVNPQTGKTQISAQIQIDKSKAAALLARLAALAEVRSQNLSQNYTQNADELKKQIAELDRELQGLMSGRYPVLMTYGIQQKQNLQAQLRQTESTENATTISLSIQDPAAVQPQPANGQQPRSVGMPAAAAAAAAAFVFGFLICRRKANP